MRRLISLLLLVLFCTVYGQVNENTQKTIKDHLLIDYDKTTRPVINHENQTNVLFRLNMKYFTLDVASSSFTLEAWVLSAWKDQHLTWTPSDYSGVTQIHISSDEIWVPDISVFNRFSQGGDPGIIQSSNCLLNNAGGVVCVSPHTIDGLCVPNLKYYPFDTQDCEILLGSWSYQGEHMNISLMQKSDHAEDLISNGEWDLIGYKETLNPGVLNENNSFPVIKLDFKMKRLSGPHVASVIIPSIVGIILTLTSLWLSAENKDRIILCCVNFFGAYLHVQYVSWMVPLKGENTPLIIVMARDMLLLCSFTIPFSVLLKDLVVKQNPAPVWISSVVSLVTSCRPGQIIFLNDYSVTGVAQIKGEEDGNTIIDSETNAKGHTGQDWIIFSKILDRLLFIIYCIIYFIMFFEFLP